jgi:hypothetical protein
MVVAAVFGLAAASLEDRATSALIDTTGGRLRHGFHNADAYRRQRASRLGVAWVALFALLKSERDEP